MDIRSGPERPASRCFTSALAIAVLTTTLSAVLTPLAEAAKWSRAYIRSLPDEAFAAIETTAGGRRLRRLPHHDHAGALDLPHLKSALARFHQVRWRDPAAAAAARAHLEAHRASLPGAGRRSAGATRDGSTGP